MPNSNTFSIKPIKELIEKYAIGKIVDPFANSNKLATVTNDLDTQYDTDYHMDALDFLKMFDDNSVDTVLYDPPYCYDGETDIFTSDGWKNIKNINKNDFIATLNINTNKLEYHKPLEVIKKKYKGNMVSINSQSINMLVTPNHRCYVKNSFYGKYKWVYAKDLFKNSNRQWFKKACDWDGYEEKFFILPRIELEKPNRYGEKFKPEKYIPMDTWLKFLGLYLSEGNYKENFKKDGDRHYRYTISIAQTKEYGRKKIKEVLDELGYKYSVSKNDFRIDDKQLWCYLKQFGKTKDKFIPNKIKQLSKRQLSILIEYLMIGDGTRKTYPKLNKTANKIYHYSTNTYFTSSIPLMNDFCEIAIKCGHAISIKEKTKENYDIVFAIHVLGAKDFRVDKKRCNKEIKYDDYVYCVTVPNSTLLVKRKGRVFWCGNSPRQVSECYKNLGQTVNMQTTQASYWSKQKEQIGRIVKKNGIVITCSWNSGGIGKKYGFEIQEILLVPHGGWHNDTIVVVEKKIE